MTSLGGSIHVLRSYLNSALFTATTTGEWMCFTDYLVTSQYLRELFGYYLVILPVLVSNSCFDPFQIAYTGSQITIYC